MAYPPRWPGLTRSAESGETGRWKDVSLPGESDVSGVLELWKLAEAKLYV